MRNNRTAGRWLSILLTLAMVLTMLPTAALAAGSDETGLNDTCHTRHDEACGYVAAREAVPCGHLVEGVYNCAPEDAGEDYVCLHNDDCGYAEAAEGVPCAHTCEACQEAPAAEPEPDAAALAAENQTVTDPLVFTEDTPNVTDQPGYSWEQSSKTLTLKGITMDVDSTGHIISVPDGTHVVLAEGMTNNITIKGWSATASRYGICAVSPSGGGAASMTFEGTGTLNINATEVTAFHLGGLLAEGGGTITVEGGNINLFINGNSRGSESGNGQTGDICGIKAGSLNITGGSVLAGGKWAAVRLGSQPNEENLKISGSTEVLDNPAQVAGAAAWVGSGNFPNYKVGGEVAKTLYMKYEPPADYYLWIVEGAMYKNDGTDPAEPEAYTGNDGKWRIEGTTLTLKEGFSFTTTADTVLEIADGSVTTITVEGNASLTSTFNDAADMGVYGLYAAAALTINGAGTLTVQSGNDTSTSEGQSAALFAEAALTVDGATVSLTAGSGTGSMGLAMYSGGLTLKNGALLTAASAEAGTDRGCGVMVIGALTVEGDASKLTAKGATYAYVGAAINESYALTASTSFAGDDANSDGITTGTFESLTIYKKGNTDAKFLTVAADSGGGEDPEPVTADYTLYYNAADGKLYKDRIGGTEVTTADVPKWSGDGTTLTLEDGFSFSTTAATALVMPAGSALTVNGTASLTSTYEGAGTTCGIKSSSGSFTISGSGTLNVQGGKDTTGPGGLSAGILLENASSTLTVQSATVNATGGDVTGSGDTAAYSIGLKLAGGLRLTGGATVNATTVITDQVILRKGCGVQMSGSLVLADNSTLTAKGGYYAYVGTLINRNYTKTVSMNLDGTNGTSSGITYYELPNPGGLYAYYAGGYVKYLTVTDRVPKSTITVNTQPQDATVTFGETATLTAAASANNNKDVTYKWYKANSADSTGGASLVSSTGSSFTIPADLDVGSHYYFCTLSAEGCDPVNTNIVTVTVEKKEYTGLKVSKVYVTAGTAASKTYTLPELPAGASYGTVTVQNTLAGAIASDPAPTVENGVLSYSITDKLEDRATPSIRIAVTGADNYADYTFTLIVAGTGKTPVTISGLSAQEHIVYNGQPQTGYTGTAVFIGADGMASSPEVTSALTNSIVCYYEGIGNSYWGGEDEPVPPTDAGSYLASVTAETETHIGAVDIAFTIAPKAVTVGLPADQTITAGDPMPDFTPVFTGVVEGESLTFGEGYEPDITTPPNADTAGTYTITWNNASEATVIAGNTETNADNYTVTTQASCKLIINAGSGGGGGTGGGGGGGGGGGTGGSSITVPVTGQDSVKVNASVSGSTATVSSIDASKVGVENTLVTIDLSDLDKTIDKVSLPAKSVGDIVNAGAEGLELRLSTGSVTFDGAALSAIADAAKGSTISLEAREASTSSLSAGQRASIADLDNAVLVQINMVSDGRVISDFKGGQAAVTIPYELKPGQDPDSVTVYFLASDGTLTAMETSYDARTGTVTFLAPHFSSYVISSEAGGWVNPFTDVKSGDWFYEAVRLMHERDLMSGTSATTFSPSGATTRGMIVAILYRLEGRPSSSGEGAAFTDVPAGRYYSDAAAWAGANGIVAGYRDGRFGPNDRITRQQMAAILYRYAQYKGGDTAASGDLSAFPDRPAPYAAEAMGWAVGKGIITGEGSGALNPAGSATRAQVAVMLQRFLTAQ